MDGEQTPKAALELGADFADRGLNLLSRCHVLRERRTANNLHSRRPKLKQERLLWLLIVQGDSERKLGACLAWRDVIIM